MNDKTTTISEIKKHISASSKSAWSHIKIDSKTIGTIAKSKHWGSGRFNQDLRDSIDTAYKKSGSISAYKIETNDSHKMNM